MDGSTAADADQTRALLGNEHDEDVLAAAAFHSELLILAIWLSLLKQTTGVWNALPRLHGLEEN